MQGTNAICTQLVTLDPQIAAVMEWVLIGSNWSRRWLAGGVRGALLSGYCLLYGDYLPISLDSREFRLLISNLLCDNGHKINGWVHPLMSFIAEITPFKAFRICIIAINHLSIEGKPDTIWKIKLHLLNQFREKLALFVGFLLQWLFSLSTW